jgi:hypothetical protein
MVSLTKGQQDPELSMGSALVSCIWHRKPKTGVSDVERKAGSLLLLLHYTLFGVHVVCRSTFVHRMHGVFRSLLFVSIARMVIVRTKR